jgi:hypothetical protein
MRRLSDVFLAELKSGFLSDITRMVIADPDLNLEIREDYINVYCKGASLLRLVEAAGARYQVAIHPKYAAGLNVPAELADLETTARFLACVPRLKQNIAALGKRSLEIEYEQMLIRANNYERRNASEYFIVDRQYAIREGRFDLIGVFWDRKGRRRGQEVPVCLMELKFALNRDIADVHSQLARYYEAVKPLAASIAEEGETIFRQKLELGLYDQSPKRIEAMKTLTFARDIARFQFVVVLVDYNPNSALLDLAKLAQLPFADQVKVFFGGFAMWQQNVKPLAALNVPGTSEVPGT